jgi:hypothetical protein
MSPGRDIVMATSLPCTIEVSTSARLLSYSIRPLKLDERILAISIAVKDVLFYINGNPFIN